MKKIFFCLVVLFTVSLLATPLETAKKLFDEEEKYFQAIEIFNELDNEAEADYYLGKAYLYGLGVEKDEKKAFEYGQKSAKQNNPSGLNLLGVMYENGIGVNADILQALMYYQQSVNLGSTKAMRNIGTLYYEGKLIQKDLKKAETFFNRAIDAGDFEAALVIGGLYHNEKNFKEAVKWYLFYEELVNFKTTVKFKETVSYLCKVIQDEQNAIRLSIALLKAENYKYAYDLYDYLKNNNYPEKQEEILFWLEKAADPKYNKTSSLKLTQESLYAYYYYDTKQFDKALKIAERLYYDNSNIKMGCFVAQYYGSDYKKTFDFEKAYTIATDIINSNGASYETQFCYTTLAYLYERGSYVTAWF